MDDETGRALLLMRHREEDAGRAYTPFTPRSHDHPCKLVRASLTAADAAGLWPGNDWRLTPGEAEFS